MRIKYLALTLAAFILSDTTNAATPRVNVGLYIGPAFYPDLTDVHGLHPTPGDPDADLTFGNLHIDENIALGINARYSLTDYLEFHADAMHSQVELRAQYATLTTMILWQPKSDWKFTTLSLGPALRYKALGLFQHLNPYTAITFSMLTGSASDVDTTPVYGQGGSSSIDGTGYSLRLGTQYNFRRLSLSIEYRYESMQIELDRFRSFVRGLSATKKASYLTLGAAFRF